MGKDEKQGKGKPKKAQLKKARRRIATLEEEVAELQAVAAEAIAKRDRAKVKRDRAKEKAAKWKAEARQERTTSAKLESQLRRGERRAPVDAEPPSERGDLPVADGAPDATWTVARLRQDARQRGVSGYSRMTKAQLLDVLSA